MSKRDTNGLIRLLDRGHQLLRDDSGKSVTRVRRALDHTGRAIIHYQLSIGSEVESALRVAECLHALLEAITALRYSSGKSPEWKQSRDELQRSLADERFAWHRHIANCPLQALENQPLTMVDSTLPPVV